MEQEDRGVLGDMGDLTEQQVTEAEKVLEYLATTVDPDSTAGIALLLLRVEFRVAQAKADGWAFYQGMKVREARIQGVQLSAAQAAGALEGGNAEERKRNLSVFTGMDPEILGAKSDTIGARNMSDCLSNAHSSVSIALTLIMGMVQYEDTD